MKRSWIVGGWLVAMLAADSVAGSGPATDAQGVLEQVLGNCVDRDGEAKRFAASDALPLAEISLGDPLEDFVRQFPQGFFRPLGVAETFLHTGSPMRLSLDLGGERVLAKTGGMSNVVTLVDASPVKRRLYSVEFYDQQCPVTHEIALTRAQDLEAKLARAGFEREPALIVAERYGDPSPLTFRSWDEGAAVLAQTPRVVAAVSSRWHRGQEQATVSVWNWGAPEPQPLVEGLQSDLPSEFGGTVFEVDGTGRKYGVQFRIEDRSMFEADLGLLDSATGLAR